MHAYGNIGVHSDRDTVDYLERYSRPGHLLVVLIEGLLRIIPGDKHELNLGILACLTFVRDIRLIQLWCKRATRPAPACQHEVCVSE